MITILIYCALIFIILNLHDYIPKKYRQLYHYESWFTFVEYITFALIFLYSIQNKIFRKAIIGLSIAFIIFQVTFILNVKPGHLDSFPVGVETILIFLYSFYFLYQEFRKENQFLYKNAMFWISIGIFFYLAGSFFFNILANHLTDEELTKYWFYSYLFDVVKNIFIAFGFLFYRQKYRETLPYLDMDLHQPTNH